MGKRFLVSLLLFLLIVVGVAAGAAFIFHQDYQDLSALQSEAASTPSDETFGQTDELPVVSNTPVEPAASGSDLESGSVPRTN